MADEEAPGPGERVADAVADKSIENEKYVNGRQVFILSNSGKPVYCRYGNENDLSTLFGVMQVCRSFPSSTCCALCGAWEPSASMLATSTAQLLVLLWVKFLYLLRREGQLLHRA